MQRPFHSIAVHDTALQYNTLCCTILHDTILHYAMLCCAALTALITLNGTTLHCTAPLCNLLHCFVSLTSISRR